MKADARCPCRDETMKKNCHYWLGFLTGVLLLLKEGQDCGSESECAASICAGISRV